MCWESALQRKQNNTYPELFHEKMLIIFEIDGKASIR